MNLQAIYLANAIGFILIAFLFISRFITRTRSQAEDHIFNIMMYLAMLACVVEPVTFAVDGQAGRVCYWINLLGNTYLYFANGFGSFLFVIYVDRSLYHSGARIQKHYAPFAVLVATMLLSLVPNIWLGYYFYVDEANVYHRQPLINIFYVYLMLCAVISIFTVYWHKHHYGKKEFFPIFMYLVPIVVGSALQMVFYGISLAWIGTSIGIVALYMSLQNQRTYVDALTGLFNRQYLEHAMFEMQKTSAPYFGIMIDMNFFKQINDNYGHSAGDRALRDTADILRAATDVSAMVFRFAGDEFIVLLKTADEGAVLDTENRIREAIDAFNREHDHPYELSLSMGHGAYDRANDDEDAFLRRIDEAMYRNKEEMHKNFR